MTRQWRTTRILVVLLAVALIAMVIGCWMLQGIAICGCTMENVPFNNTSTAIAATNDYVGTAIANTATARAATHEAPTEASP
jgi:hypothetical protein